MDPISGRIRKYTEFADLIGQTDGRRIPLSGSIDLTSRCNLRCKHCYLEPDFAGRELTGAEWCDLLDEMADAGCLRLLITGGEPLLRKDFLDVYAHAKHRGFLITLFTNGTLLTQEIVDYLKEYPPFLVEVSLFGSNQEVAERVTQTQGYFEACIRGIQLLIERKIRLVLKTIVTSDNIREIPAIRDYAGSMGVPFKYDPFIFPRLNGSKQPLALRVPATKVAELEIESIKRAPSNKRWNDFYGGGSKERYFFPDEKLFNCHAGVDVFHIDSTGMASPCILLRHPCYDVRTASFGEAWRKLVVACDTFIRTKDFKCVTCSHQDMCPWCPVKAELENGDAQSPISYFCEVVEERMNYAPKFQPSGR